MKSILGSSPITTVLGMVAGISTAAVAIVPEQYQKYCAFASAVCFILMGRSAKDSNGITSKEGKIIAEAATGGAIPPEENKPKDF